MAVQSLLMTHHIPSANQWMSPSLTRSKHSQTLTCTASFSSNYPTSTPLFPCSTICLVVTHNHVFQLHINASCPDTTPCLRISITFSGQAGWPRLSKPIRICMVNMQKNITEEMVNVGMAILILGCGRFQSS